MANRSKCSDVQKQEMLRMYNAGSSLAMLGERYNVSVPTVASYVRAMGGTVRPKGKVKKDNSVEPTVIPPSAEASSKDTIPVDSEILPRRWSGILRETDSVEEDKPEDEGRTIMPSTF